MRLCRSMVPPCRSGRMVRRGQFRTDTHHRVLVISVRRPYSTIASDTSNGPLPNRSKEVVRIAEIVESSSVRSMKFRCSTPSRTKRTSTAKRALQDETAARSPVSTADYTTEYFVGRFQFFRRGLSTSDVLSWPQSPSVIEAEFGTRRECPQNLLPSGVLDLRL